MLAKSEITKAKILDAAEAEFSEKGYFKFGGSTVILLFDNSRIKWSEDLLENSQKLYETLIRQGEVIATIK